MAGRRGRGPGGRGADLSALPAGERRARDRLGHVPVDIAPRFVTALQFEREQ